MSEGKEEKGQREEVWIGKGDEEGEGSGTEGLDK
jgi:hypothetical protein